MKTYMAARRAASAAAAAAETDERMGRSWTQGHAAVSRLEAFLVVRSVNGNISKLVQVLNLLAAGTDTESSTATREDLSLGRGCIEG